MAGATRGRRVGPGVVVALAWAVLLAVALWALSGTDLGVATSVVLWAGWVVGLVAALVPHPASLTVLRIVAPAALALGATIDGDWQPAATVGVAGLAVGLVVTAPLAEAFVDAGSYGAERRFNLRLPPLVAYVLAPLAWLAVVAPIVIAADAVDHERWTSAAAAAVVGAPAGYVAAQALHRLAKRFVVLVPNGLVLHDPLVLADPVLFARQELTALGPAETGVDGDAFDATGGATGLALVLRTRSPHPVSRARGRKGPDRGDDVTSVLFTPLRPGALLDACSEHRLPVVQAARAEPST